MNKNLITSLSLVCSLYFSCSKNKQPGPQNTGAGAIKITLVSGSGQTDTIGRSLANPIAIKVTQSGTPLSGYTVQFQGSGCNHDNIVATTTKTDGTASYTWPLAGDIGQQTLKAYVLNLQNQKVDSVSATATGLATGAGWHYSACVIPFGYLASSMCKISTGRVFTIMGGGPAYLRYSDDNGISWNSVKSLGNSHSFDYVLSTPSDEIFAFAFSEGTFYSNNAGQTWNSLTIQQFNKEQITIATCTPSGTLMVATAQTPLYVSTDKGNTWTDVAATSFSPPGSSNAGDLYFNSPTEDHSGNLYLVGDQSGTIYKSADVGKNWAPIVHPANELDFALYIDNNQWFYKSRSDANGGIYISKDNGSTYSLLVNSPNSLLEEMSVQNDGNLYYCFRLNGLFRAKGISGSVERLFNNEAGENIPYIVTKNGNIITMDIATGHVSYYTN